MLLIYRHSELGFPIAIPLRTFARNCAKLRAIVRSLQGSQLRASKIHSGWKSYSEFIFFAGIKNSRLKLKNLGFVDCLLIKIKIRMSNFYGRFLVLKKSNCMVNLKF